MLLIEILVLVLLVYLPFISVTDLGYVYLQMFTVNLLFFNVTVFHTIVLRISLLGTVKHNK
jgi:hypothetical protein